MILLVDESDVARRHDGFVGECVVGRKFASRTHARERKIGVEKWHMVKMSRQMSCLDVW